MNKYSAFDNYIKEQPDENGRFGPYGGSYLPDQLKPAFEEIINAYQTICQSAKFISELRRIRREFQGRPTPVYHCERLSNKLGKCQIYVKREDLNHTGAHKLNHCMGEGLLAKYMGKKKLIAETGAGRMASRSRPRRRFSGLNAISIWAKSISKNRRPT
jgi:tryptophan synthase beta chain